MSKQEKMVKLAVRKEPSVIPCNFHYFLFPVKMNDPEVHTNEHVWALMGYTIIEVPEERAARMLQESRAALNHQVEIAVLAEEQMAKEKKDANG